LSPPPDPRAALALAREFIDRWGELQDLIEAYRNGDCRESRLLDRAREFGRLLHRLEEECRRAAHPAVAAEVAEAFHRAQVGAVGITHLVYRGGAKPDEWEAHLRAVDGAQEEARGLEARFELSPPEGTPPAGPAAVAWTPADNLSRLANLFGVSTRTFKKLLAAGRVRHRKLTTKTYQIAVDDLPARHRPKYLPPPGPAGS
jgi:hypothetical protein